MEEAAVHCENGVKGHPHCQPEIKSSRSKDVSDIGDSGINVKEISEAVGIMQDILNPHANSDVEGQSIKAPHICSDEPTQVLGSGHALQEIKSERAHNISQNETLPLVEHSTNEELRSSEVNMLPRFPSYDKVEEAVQEYEIETTSKFLLGNPDRDFGKMFDEIKHSHHIHLDGGGFGNEVSPKLSLDGTPYIMMGNRRLSCHHGKPHNHTAKKIKGKQRLCTQASKKVGCPSHIIIRHVMLLPDFKFDKNKVTEHRRRELSKYIKATLKEKQVTTESRFYIEFPDVNSHRNHPLGEAAGVKQPIDKRVNEKILQLISNGMKSIRLIEQTIKDYVKDELFRDSPCPPYSNRRFFPTQKDIANRIFKVSANSLSSKLKMEELEDFVYGWIEEQRAREGFVFFRSASGIDDRTVIKQESPEETPRCSHSNGRSGERYHLRTKIDSSENGNVEPSREGLLFIYQTQSQRRLLSRYGCDLTFLDPAHRAAAYAVPLYFLLVHTNCDYQIVAVIVTERESVNDLREALTLIKEANPSWSPQQFAVDSSEEEIQTVESLFPECRVSISDVRRQQAWERWLANPKHGAVKCRQKFLAKMMAVAMARTIESYQVAMDDLKGTWSQSNLKLMRTWFREKWLSNVQRWAYVFRQQRQMLPLIVNNGIESQHKALQYDFIASNCNLPLHSMLDMLINTTLPDMYTRYVQSNAKWSTIANSQLPPLLHNRPKPFIDHCQQHLTIAGKMRQPSVNQSMLNDPEHPNCSKEDNLVDPSIPSCPCDDFTRNGFLCVHLLERITDRDDLLWERLPSSYLFSPFLMVDEGAAGGEQMLGAGENEEDECVNAVSGLSPEEEATSNLEAILAAVEAQTSSISNDPSITAAPSTAEDPTSNHEATHCQEIAKELLELTHTVTDRVVLATARIQIEAVLATLRQAIPSAELHSSISQHQCGDEVLPVRIHKEYPELDEGIPPLKKRRLADSFNEDEAVIPENHVIDSEIEISIGGNEIVEVCEDGQNSETQESIVTETIDLQHGAVFILDPSGVMRNFQLTDASETDTALQTAILKDS